MKDGQEQWGKATGGQRGGDERSRRTHWIMLTSIYRKTQETQDIHAQKTQTYMHTETQTYMHTETQRHTRWSPNGLSELVFITASQRCGCRMKGSIFWLSRAPGELITVCNISIGYWVLCIVYGVLGSHWVLGGSWVYISVLAGGWKTPPLDWLPRASGKLIAH